MGGRSKSKSSSGGASASGNMANAQQQVGQATQQGTNNWLQNIMGNQSSMIGQMLGPLIQGGQEMMASNPGMKNFMADTGQKAQELGQADWLQNFAEAARGWAPKPMGGESPAQPGQQQSPGMMRGLAPEQQEKYQQYLQHQRTYGR
jgi:hypothetical protein